MLENRKDCDTMAIKQMITNTLTRKAAAESQELIRLRWQKAMLERAIAKKKRLKDAEMMK
jgi:hypothetical protein